MTTYRVHWTPGTDRLLAVCHCASWRQVDDPVEAWAWLLAHPQDHLSDHPLPPEPVDPPAAVPAGRPA